MIIAVFGCGFVGETVAGFLTTKNVKIIRVDPKLYPNVDKFKAIEEADGIVIAVPTPANSDGSCDDSIIQQVLQICGSTKRVLLKSTVTYDLIKKYSNNVIYNPEFLREAFAKEDFNNQHTFILGHENNKLEAEWWAELFGFNIADCILTNRQTASAIKYTHNSFLATKVAWFHELYDNLPLDIDYNIIINTLARFDTIGNSHMKAPNNEGTLGYGGNCFPKDVKAFIKVINHTILETVNNTNNKLKK